MTCCLDLLTAQRITSKMLNQLNTNKRSMEDTIGKLANTGKQLQDKEKVLREKGAFFTNVALFFGKLSVLATDVDHNVDDVVDLVEALDDTTPTIIDVKSPGNELLSLSDALEKFIHFYTADAPLLDESGITLSAKTARIQSVKEIPRSQSGNRAWAGQHRPLVRPQRNRDLGVRSCERRQVRGQGDLRLLS